MKNRESYFCMDSMTDVLLDTYGELQEVRETLDDQQKLKCAWRIGCSDRAEDIVK